jgi:hypothetical protein
LLQDGPPAFSHGFAASSSIGEAGSPLASPLSLNHSAPILLDTAAAADAPFGAQ